MYKYSVTNNTKEECGSDSSKNDDKNSSYDSLNGNFNDNDPETNLDDFSVTSQYNYATLDYSDLLSHDNDYTEEFIISTDLIPITNSGDISYKVQEKVKYGFKFSGCNILNNVISLMTRN